MSRKELYKYNPLLLLITEGCKIKNPNISSFSFIHVPVLIFLRCSWSSPRSRKMTRMKWDPLAPPSSGSGCGRTAPSPPTTPTASCTSCEPAMWIRVLAVWKSRRPSAWVRLLSLEVCMCLTFVHWRSVFFGIAPNQGRFTACWSHISSPSSCCLRSSQGFGFWGYFWIFQCFLRVFFFSFLRFWKQKTEWSNQSSTCLKSSAFPHRVAALFVIIQRGRCSSTSIMTSQKAQRGNVVENPHQYM